MALIPSVLFISSWKFVNVMSRYFVVHSPKIKLIKHIERFLQGKTFRPWFSQSVFQMTPATLKWRKCKEKAFNQFVLKSVVLNGFTWNFVWPCFGALTIWIKRKQGHLRLVNMSVASVWHRCTFSYFQMCFPTGCDLYLWPCDLDLRSTLTSHQFQ